MLAFFTEFFLVAHILFIFVADFRKLLPFTGAPLPHVSSVASLLIY